MQIMTGFKDNSTDMDLERQHIQDSALVTVYIGSIDEKGIKENEPTEEGTTTIHGILSRLLCPMSRDELGTASLASAE